MPFKKPSVSFEEAMAGSRAERGLKALKVDAGITPAPAQPAVVEPAPQPARIEPEIAAPPPAAAAEPQPARPVRTPPPVRAPRPAVTAPPAHADAVAPDDDLKLSIPITAPHPAPGVSPSFDAIAADHGQRAAMLAVLKRAWPEIEARLAAGEAIDRAATYPMSAVDTDTTRRLAPALLEAARKHLDPHGISSQRKLGRMLATVALAAYFAREGTR